MTELFLECRQLSLEGAKIIANAAEAEAIANGWNVSIAVVDAGCHPIYIARMPQAILASFDGALNKARTSVLFGRPTKRLEDAVAAGRLHYMTFRDVLPVDGGLPILVDGVIIGGIGVGGTPTGAEGTRCAEAGIAALEAKRR